MELDVIFYNPDGKWDNPLTGLTSEKHGDNVTALYTHTQLPGRYGYHAPGNKVKTNITIFLIK